MRATFRSGKNCFGKSIFQFSLPGKMIYVQGENLLSPIPARSTHRKDWRFFTGQTREKYPEPIYNPLHIFEQAKF
jgi:hypothetical protein